MRTSDARNARPGKVDGRLAFLDFWPGFEDNTDRWFSKDWFRTNLRGIQVVEPQDHPDVIMFSLFGRSHVRHLQSGSTSKLVFFTGENVRPPVGRIPLCISFDQLEDVPHSLHTRMPLWIFNKEVHTVLQIHEARLRNNVNTTVRNRAGFCSFVASNATMYNAEFRTRFVQILSSKYKEVACGGEVLNNVGGPVRDKMDFLRGYRFNVCFENASHPGYCTEKILHAFASESIPIYWGDPSCSSRGKGMSDFNTRAFISAHDFENTAQLIKHIARVEADPVLFESYLREPILADHWYRRLKDWSGFCSGFRDLLFAECHLGTPRLVPGAPPGQGSCAAAGGERADRGNNDFENSSGSEAEDAQGMVRSAFEYGENDSDFETDPQTNARMDTAEPCFCFCASVLPHEHYAGEAAVEKQLEEEPRKGAEDGGAWRLAEEESGEDEILQAGVATSGGSPRSGTRGSSLLDGLRLEHHLSRLASYAQKIASWVADTRSPASGSLPVAGDESATDQDFGVSTANASETLGQAVETTVFSSDVDGSDTKDDPPMGRNRKDRELLQIYRSAQIEASKEADWRGLGVASPSRSEGSIVASLQFGTVEQRCPVSDFSDVSQLSALYQGATTQGSDAELLKAALAAEIAPWRQCEPRECQASMPQSGLGHPTGTLLLKSQFVAASLHPEAPQSLFVMMHLGWAFVQLLLLAPGARSEASVPLLRGSTRGLAELPSCSEKPNFHLARASWCGEQKEPVACAKDSDSPNPIWDCHLQADAWCSLGGSPCSWPLGAPPREVSSDWQNQNSQGQATRFVTWNLYVFTLAGRIHPVVDELLRMQPEIAAIPEMWHEKGAILDLLNQRSGNVYAFATGGATEQFNDADILFRSDKWEHIASDLVPFSAGRAINWAALRRKSDGYTLIASGTHPLCCQGDYVITEAVDFVTKTLSQVQNQHPYPIVLMGDLNTGYFQPSQQLLRQGQVEAFGRHWQIPMTFTDAWAELHPGNPDPSTINDDPVRLDYVYFQKTPFSVGQSIVQSQIWPRAAGSDHRAVSGDVVLSR
ncbi:putative fucosyltransferase [Symbiodinium microadriaticum]|uniref:Fucosyltransferase n=1 Tax=Symbiodinium microadriaticum TaxID=2951 RepID=A0A1Q9EK80_SYMMI|nr:putative fucosyltransferase [Symbiodinium microadriaticum]